MRRLIAILFILLLTAIPGSEVLAAPPSIGWTGSFFTFGELGIVQPESYLGLGIGYRPYDGFSLGIQASYTEGDTFFGGFAGLDYDQFQIQGEFVFQPGYSGRLTALYAFEASPFNLGMGGGLAFDPLSDCALFLQGQAQLRLNRNISLYGRVDYLTNLLYVTATGGITLSF